MDEFLLENFQGILLAGGQVRRERRLLPWRTRRGYQFSIYRGRHRGWPRELALDHCGKRNQPVGARANVECLGLHCGVYQALPCGLAYPNWKSLRAIWMYQITKKHAEADSEMITMTSIFGARASPTG